MPKPGDVRTENVTMYRIECINARRTINNLQNMDGHDVVTWLGTFLGFAEKPLGLASALVAIAAGLPAYLSSRYLEKQEDMYTNLIEEMSMHTNPLIYVVVTQRFIYVKNNRGEGWAADGDAYVSKYSYRDY